MDIRYVLEEKAKRYRAKPAIIFKNQTISFDELNQKVIRLASVLSELGIKKSDKVGIFLPNCPEYVYSYLACFYLGAVAVPLDYLLKSEEMISCLSHSDTKVLIALPKNEISFQEIKGTVPSLKFVLSIGEPNPTEPFVRSYAQLMGSAQSHLPAVKVDDADPALILYTSGTTGRPKGIQLNYKHLEGSPRAMEYFVDLSDRDIKLVAIPFSHVAGFIYIQNCIIFGISLVVMERFHPLEFLKNVAEYKVTCFHIVPAMYTAFLTVKNIDKFDLSSLRWVVVFGAPSSPEILERFRTHCPQAQLLNGWGMTETCPPNTVTPLGSRNIKSIGKPSPLCRITIVDDDGGEVNTDEIGEIIISGWVVMDGYYKDPEMTAAVKRNGWLYSGDLGKFDREGFLYIVGRKKEMIKVGGQIVFAPEVEATFYKNEAVAEVAVIGIEDKLRGEAVKAFVVLKEGARLSPEELRYFAREHLANFKVPQSIEIRTGLPKNRTGKIDKEALKDAKERETVF